MGAYGNFYLGLCVCRGNDVYLPMKTTTGVMTDSFPVEVFNVNEGSLGMAYDKEQYINIWNADHDNSVLGVLKDLLGLFSFTLVLRTGAVSPEFVLGNPPDLVLGDFNNDFSNDFNI